VHNPTGFRELAPANAANYFLQLINMAVAGGALFLFLNRRKHVHWRAGSLAEFVASLRRPGSIRNVGFRAD
jgi:hypothetical protein